MKTALRNLLTVFSIAMTTNAVHAVDTNGVTTTVTKALSCELPPRNGPSVIKALQALGAKQGNDKHDFVLATPARLTVFGLPVNRVSVSLRNDGDEPYVTDTYMTVFAGARLDDIVKAANLDPLAGLLPGAFFRDTKTGRLMANVRNGGEVWLTCTPMRTEK